MKVYPNGIWLLTTILLAILLFRDEPKCKQNLPVIIVSSETTLRGALGVLPDFAILAEALQEGEAMADSTIVCWNSAEPEQMKCGMIVRHIGKLKGSKR